MPVFTAATTAIVTAADAAHAAGAATPVADTTAAPKTAAAASASATGDFVPIQSNRLQRRRESDVFSVTLAQQIKHGHRRWWQRPQWLLLSLLSLPHWLLMLMLMLPRLLFQGWSCW